MYLTDPISGLIANIRWVAAHPADALVTLDMWALAIALILSFAAFAFPRHRRPTMVAYRFAFILFFLSKVNYAYGTRDEIFTQSFARYSLTLFTLVFLVADGLRSARPLVRVVGVALLVAGVAVFSALYVLALTGP
jgi:hypothetical protein